MEGFSNSDLTHTVHYLLKLLDNMKEIDAEQGHAPSDDGDAPVDLEAQV